MIEQQTISEKLKRRRQEQGLSLAAVAEVTNISPSTLSRLEKGAGKLDMSNFAALARYLDLPLDGYEIRTESGSNMLESMSNIIRSDPNVRNPEGLCRLFSIAYREMAALR